MDMLLQVSSALVLPISHLVRRSDRAFTSCLLVMLPHLLFRIYIGRRLDKLGATVVAVAALGGERLVAVKVVLDQRLDTDLLHLGGHVTIHTILDVTLLRPARGMPVLLLEGKLASFKLVLTVDTQLLLTTLDAHEPAIGHVRGHSALPAG